jgi:hypothetical protein
MNTSPRALDAELLAELDRRLRERGVPAIGAAQPGLSEEAINEIVAPLGLSLPREARLWWSWHNGVQPDAGPGPREIGPTRKWLPLEEAAEECGRIRKMVREARDPRDPRPIESIWSSSWLPFVQSNGVYVIETAVPDDAPCPVRVHWFDEPETPPDLPSLGALVSLWIEALDRRAWSYDRQGDHWTVNHDILMTWPAAKRGLI